MNTVIKKLDRLRNEHLGEYTRIVGNSLNPSEEQSESANEHWMHYKNITQKMKKLGFTEKGNKHSNGRIVPISHITIL